MRLYERMLDGVAVRSRRSIRQHFGIGANSRRKLELAKSTSRQLPKTLKDLTRPFSTG